MARIVKLEGTSKVPKQNHKCLKGNVFSPLFQYCPDCGEYLFEEEPSNDYRCSACLRPLISLLKPLNFCHNCGAKFEEEKFEGNK